MSTVSRAVKSTPAVATSRTRADRATSVNKPPSFKKSQSRWGRAFAAPAVIGFLVFTLGPMVASIIISFTDWNIGGSPHMAGLDNYQKMLADPKFYHALKATVIYALIAVPGTILVAFCMALLMHRIRRGVGLFRTIFYLPVLVPPVANSILWMWMYDPTAGILNTILKFLHLPTSQWIYAENTAVPSIALMAMWAFGNMAIIFLSALQGVPRELLEAAEMDGANAWMRMWHVTMPQISPIILFNLITGLVGAFQQFDTAFIMTSGGPNDATLFYVFYLYSKAFTDGQLGYACALAWVLFLLILVATLLVFRSSDRWVYAGGAK